MVLVEDSALPPDRAEVFAAAYAWVELADFIPAYLTGNLDPDTLPRGICAAGHKAMYNAHWGGLPSKQFLRQLDPALAALARPLRQAGLAVRSAGRRTDRGDRRARSACRRA